MPNFCKYCGDPVTEGELFCDNCGKRIESGAPPPAPPPPKSVCARCGAELNPTAKFCRSCGAPASGTPSPRPAPKTPPPLPKTGPAATPSAPAAPPRKKRGKKGCCGCVFGLVAVVLAVLGIVALYHSGILPGGGGESLDDILERMASEGSVDSFLATDFPITKETSPGNPRLIETTWSELDILGAEVFPAAIPPGVGSISIETSAGTVGVDFASLNPEDKEKEDALIVHILPELHDANSGMTLHGYDFSLESGRHDFTTRNRITIPRHAPDNKDGQVYYYNPDTKEYEFVYYEVSEDGKSYHAYLDHFSTVVEGIPDYFHPINNSVRNICHEPEYDRNLPVMARSVAVSDKDLEKWMKNTGFDLRGLSEKGITPAWCASLVLDSLGAYDTLKSDVGIAGDLLETATQVKLGECISCFGNYLIAAKILYELTVNPSQDLWKVFKKDNWSLTKDIALSVMSGGAEYAFGAPAGAVIVACSFTYTSFGLLQAVLRYTGEPPLVKLIDWQEAAYQDYLKKYAAGVTVGNKRYAVSLLKSTITKEDRQRLSREDIALFEKHDLMYITVRDIIVNNKNDPEQFKSDIEKLRTGYLRFFWDGMTLKQRAELCFNRYLNYYQSYFHNLPPETDLRKFGAALDTLRRQYLENYRDPPADEIDDYVAAHETYIDKCIQSRIRAVLWDDYCQKQENLKKVLADKVLPALNDRIYFYVKDPTLPKEAHFDKSPYSAYHKDRKLEDYARYMRFLDAKGRSVKAGALLGFAFYPNNADKSEYGEESFQPYPRENTDLVFHCTRYHYMQMGAPGWLVLNGRQTWPEVRIPIEKIPPPDGSGTTRVELVIPNEALKADLRRFTGVWVPIEMNGKLLAQDWIIGLVFVEKYNEFCEFEGPAGRITTSLRSWMEIKHFDFDERTGSLTIDFVKNNPDRGQDTATFQIDRSDRLVMKNSRGTYVFLRQPPAESAFGPDFAKESAAFLEKVREDSAKAPRDRPVGHLGGSVATAGTITIGGK